MKEVTLVRASRADPDRPSSSVSASSSSSPLSIANYLAPGLAYILRLQRLLHSACVFLCLRAYLLASTVVCAGGKFGLRTHRSLVRPGAAMTAQLVYETWESGAVKALRRRVFHEFTSFILGSGNTVILMLFWPGWWVLVGTAYACWCLWG
ncbi:hypothetical protein ACO1O0_004717 [Amphichorda felina]